MVEARPYQERAEFEVRERWSAGVRSVLLVAPTGAGKTLLGSRLVGEVRALWVAHRRELVTQTAARLRETFGARSVGLVLPGEYSDSAARIQVGTVQTLLARGARPPADLLVLDEAHHYLAEDWRRLRDSYPNARCLGLTATPERQDGEPLGDIFEAIVVAAQYSELVAGGYLVSARVLQPPMNLGSDLAQDPVEAWTKHSEGSQTFVFCARVPIAHDVAQRFRSLGVQADTIEANTSKRDRDEALERFRRGTLRVLTNVNTLTEGVDVPEARCVVLARAFGHVGGYLQAVGRVLRPASGKADAIVIDLIGATLRHGLPTDDRSYSLAGRAISGMEREAPMGEREAFTQTVRGVELQLVGGAPATALPVTLRPIDEAERKAEFQRLLALARQHRMRDGFAAAKYREKYGEWPREEWS